MIMNFFDIDNIAFTMAGTGVSWLELISVIAGLTCVVLAGRNSKFNFWVGYLYNILLFVMFWQRHLYSAMLLQPIAFGINAFGQWRWSHPKTGEESSKDAKSLKVSHLDPKQWVWAALFVVVAGLVWGWVLSRLGTTWLTGTFSPDPTPYLDSFGLMLTLLAQFLSAQKKWDCWLVWLVVNIWNIILYISAGLVFMPIVSALYLINGIWSLITWYKLYKNNN
jgi:nicotinamide mononucleotide transporter